MKISVDPVTDKPSHSLSKKDILTIWPLIPAEWTAPIQTVRLCNQLDKPATAVYSFVTHRLNIFGRGRDQKELLWSVLAELLLHYSMTHPTPQRKLSESQKKKIDAEIAPLLTLILKKLKESNHAFQPTSHST